MQYDYHNNLNIRKLYIYIILIHSDNLEHEELKIKGSLLLWSTWTKVHYTKTHMKTFHSKS